MEDIKELRLQEKGVEYDMYDDIIEIIHENTIGQHAYHVPLIVPEGLDKEELLNY